MSNSNFKANFDENFFFPNFLATFAGAAVDSEYSPPKLERVMPKIFSSLFVCDFFYFCPIFECHIFGRSYQRFFVWDKHLFVLKIFVSFFLVSSRQAGVCFVLATGKLFLRMPARIRPSFFTEKVHKYFFF